MYQERINKIAPPQVLSWGGALCALDGACNNMYFEEHMVVIYTDTYPAVHLTCQSHASCLLDSLVVVAVVQLREGSAGNEIHGW